MIQIKSPTRVDLSGGTLDCWPLYVFVNEAVTVNLAIDVNAVVKLEPKDSRECEIIVRDLDARATFSTCEDFLADTKEAFSLVREVVRVIPPQKGFRLETESQSPVGAGLGGSSAMTISLLKAFREFAGQGYQVKDCLSVVELAHNVEARVLNKPTGTQDYIPAFLGGLNAIHYRPGGVSIEPLDIDPQLLTDNMLLIYTGRPHHSGLNNWQVIKATVEQDRKTLVALSQIAEISQQIYRVLKTNRTDLLPELFNLESQARIQLSEGFSSPEIEKLRQRSVDLGAKALKICGAGGGGCVLIWADSAHHATILNECEKSGFRKLPLKPVGRLEKGRPSLIEAF